MANVYRSALQLLEDLSSGSHDPRSYADLLEGGQNDIGMAIAGGEQYTSSYERQKRMKKLLQVPEGETTYLTQSLRDPKYALSRAIEDYTGSSSGHYNTPFRRRRVEQLADSADYQDPHVKKQVEANTLSSHLGDNNMKKIAALAKSFYPAPADFITWRGIPPTSRTLKEHWYKPDAPTKTADQLKEEIAAQRDFLDKFWQDAVDKWGTYANWPQATKSAWDFEVGKQNTLGNQYQELSTGVEPYKPLPPIDKFPLYDDYGSEAFLSTSVDRSSARSFADDDRGMFRILVPEGTPIRPVFPYSAHETEMEVLLPPRSLFKRTGERTGKGDVPLLYTGRGRPESDKYIGAALPIGLGAAGMPDYEDAEQ